MNIGESRLNGLLAYMDRLHMAYNAGHKCDREIDECIAAIRAELGLGHTPKQPLAPYTPYDPSHWWKYPLVQWNTVTCDSTDDKSSASVVDAVRNEMDTLKGALFTQAKQAAKLSI